MCGIGFWLFDNNELYLKYINELQLLLKRRGPNQCNVLHLDLDLNLNNKIDNIIDNKIIIFIGCVLHIQGEKLTPQPVIDSNGNILIYNGEIFGGIEYNNSDTIKILNEFQIIVNNNNSDNNNNSYNKLLEELVAFLSCIHGPYSLIYYIKSFNLLIFCRDPFGRRSLILSKNNNNIIGITSVVPNFKLLNITDNNKNNNIYDNIIFEEVNIKGIYGISLNDLYNNMTIKNLIFCPWPNNRIKLQRKLINNNVKNEIDDNLLTLKFIEILKEAVRCRLKVFNIDNYENNNNNNNNNIESYKVGVLFSGGIDSVILSILLHLCIEEIENKNNKNNKNNKYAIDLINVSFYSQNELDNNKNNISPDRIAAIVAYGELMELYPNREWRLVNVDVSDIEREHHTVHILNLIQPLHTHMDLNIGTAFWFASRGEGTLCKYTKEQINNIMNIKDENGRPLLRIGEEDAALSVGLATWNQEHLQNHKIENIEDETIKCIEIKCGRIAKSKCIRKFCKRCCLRASKKEIKHNNNNNNNNNIELICKVHKYDFKNISNNEINEINENNELINDIELNQNIINIEINETIDNNVDLLYILTPLENKNYCSTVKALLLGIGADEQMAGYGRHRTAFVRGNANNNEINNKQYEELNKELNKDLIRLWERNLGRDDRCISDHGRESWLPFLDENVVLFLQNLHLSQICSLDLPPGEGDKKLLRDVAKYFGLQNTSKFVKRAIQFGTRIAKQTNIKYHGSNRKGSGSATL